MTDPVEKYEADCRELRRLITEARGARQKSELCHALGIVHFRSGKWKLAAEAIQEARRFEPTNVLYAINFARCCNKLRDYQAAAAALSRFKKLDLGYTSFWTTFAATLRGQGQLEAALRCCSQKHILKNGHVEEITEYIGLLYRAGARDILKNIEPHFLGSPSIPENLLSGAIIYAIDAWLNHDAGKVASILDQAKSSILSGNQQSEAQSRFVIPYAKFFAMLLQSKQMLAPLYDWSTVSSKRLHVIGESHALTLAGTKFTTSGGDYGISSYVNFGTKAWHLGMPAENEYKATMDNIISGIPDRVALALCFGEIDCRRDEGILTTVNSKTVPLQQLTESTFSSYLDYVAKLMSSRSNKVNIIGVPAPCEPVPGESQLTAARFKDQIAMINLANEVLRRRASKYGWGFLDVYKITANENGISNGRFHLDGVHLSPNFLVATMAAG